jgi:hypothetical protein
MGIFDPRFHLIWLVYFFLSINSIFILIYSCLKIFFKHCRFLNVSIMRLCSMKIQFLATLRILFLLASVSSLVNKSYCFLAGHPESQTLLWN